MKKTLFVVAIVAVLVFAFAASAMAASYFPNRSSAFLGGLATATQQDEIALAAGGTKAAYISWGVASSNVNNMAGFNAGSPNAYSSADVSTATAWLMQQGPHAGYSLTTIKCQVCHSAHKAVYTGTALTPSSTGGCVSCHGAASTFGFETVAAGSALDARHGGASACTSYLCHTDSPHGADVSEYPAAASALLSDYADSQLEAAIVSGQTDAVATTEDNWAEYLIESPNNVFGLGVGTYSRISIDIYQPDFDLTAEAALTDPQTPADIALGRAVATGYTCANEGCHVNGSFNGMSSGSWYGQWEFYDASNALIDPDTLVAGSLAADGIDLARREPISGHALFSVLTTSTENPLGTAWNESALCVDCHDQQDPRTSSYAFPHSNTIWAANSGVGSTVFETIGGTAYTALYNSAAWFKLGEYAGGTTVNTSIESRDYDFVGTTGKTYEPLTVAMDGACLKCHDNADGRVDGGVGDTF